MKNQIKKIIKLYLPEIIVNSFIKKQNNKQIEAWIKNGRPVPAPHIIKQLIIDEYRRKSGYSTLIETGTFLGDMVEVQSKNFKKIISIELGIELFEKAKKRFEKVSHIQIVQGDSGKVLPGLLENNFEPVIFWLDGHYSAGVTAIGDKVCPIFEELDAIFNSRPFNHILLIDDARLFIGDTYYPSKEQLTAYIKSKNEKYRFEVRDDVIRYEI